MHDLTKAFGKRVRARRAALGWNQPALANRARMAPTTVGRIERGESSPTLATVQRLAEALGVDPTELLRPIDEEHA